MPPVQWQIRGGGGGEGAWKCTPFKGLPSHVLSIYKSVNVTTYTMAHTNHSRIPQQIAKDPMTHS